MILPDYPIEHKNQDQLKRFPLASKVAAMVSAFTAKESFVIGIEGRWGSGKTSFINLVLGQLDNSKTIFFKFNPWNFSDEASLLRDFFIKFSQVVEKITGKKTGSRMKEYAARLSDVDLGISYEGFSINPLKFLKLWERDTSLEALRGELDGSLANIQKKIVVVIDDIDRLDKKETKLILKLVKLTADFPKTIFILAYDRTRVEERITEKDNGLDGGEYLKKIIQVSFTLPTPDQQELWKILFKDLDTSLEAIYRKTILSDQEESRWGELFRSGFNDLFGTIRDIKRYISSLRLDWSIMGKDDVNKIDFIGIEAIRVFAPRFYDAIPANKELFIETLKSIAIGNKAEAVAAQLKNYEELLATTISDVNLRKKIDGICEELFPQLNSRSMMPSSDEWERELRICSPEHFDFYFQLGIPFGEISENQIDEIIASMENREEFKTLILRFKEENRLRKVLAKLLRRLNKIDKEKIKTAISVIWESEKQIEEGREAVFDLDDVETQVLRIGYHALKQLPAAEREPLLAELIEQCPNLYFPAHLLGVLRQDYDKNNQVPDLIILDDADLKKLEKSLAEKIKAAAQNGSLIDGQHLAMVLYRWKDWESADAVKEYIRNLISTRKGLLAFLKGFVHKVLSTAGNYNDINKNSIAGLYPINEVETLVAAITDAELSQMTAVEKDAVERFRNPRKEW